MTSLCVLRLLVGCSFPSYPGEPVSTRAIVSSGHPEPVPVGNGGFEDPAVEDPLLDRVEASAALVAILVVRGR
jgi:hypothetical protein